MSFRFCISIFLLLSHQLFAGILTSPFNKQKLNTDSLSSNYTFLCWGHWYGSPLNWASVLPSSSILSNIEKINQMNPAFILSLGDIYRQTDSITLSHFQSLILNKLSPPLFNAPGNHELQDRTYYENHFGKTYYSFHTKNECYIILDSEVNSCELEGDQLNFLKQALDAAALNPSFKNIFILSHKFMWISFEDEFVPIFKDIISEYPCYNKPILKNEIYPLLIELSTKKSIYWISGDHGFSVFYHKVKDHDITFLSCAIKDSEEDAFLQITLNDGKVNIQPHSFVGKHLASFENYNIDYWRKQIPHMTVIDKIQLMVKDKYYWVGVASSLFLLLIGITFLRFRK